MATEPSTLPPQMLEDIPPTSLPASANYAPTVSAGAAIKRVRYWHEYVIDLMLTNPELNQNQIAAMLGKTPAWLSRVVNSDMFQMAKAQRRADHNSGIHASIVDKLESLADLALDAMTERVLQHGNTLPMSTLKETCDMALKSMGYGSGAGRGGQGPIVQVNVHQTTPSALADARERLRKVNEVPDGANAQQVPSLEELSSSGAGGMPTVGVEVTSLDWAEYEELSEASGAAL